MTYAVPAPACSRLLCLASLRSGSKESGDDVALGR